MSHSPRPAFRASLLRRLFDSDESVRQRDTSSSPRDTMDVDADRELLPDEPPRAARAPSAGARDTMDVVPERDLLPDGPLRAEKRTEEDEHIVATHVDIAELGTRRHPLSSPPTARDVVENHSKRGGGWVVLAGAALLLLPVFLGARKPPQPAKPETAAPAAAPPPVALATSTPHALRDEHELAIRFALAREPGDGLDARREVALDPVYLTSPKPAARRPRSDKPAFDPAVAMAAIRNAGLGSAQCGEGAAGATVVSVTFAPSGRVTRALVEDGPLQGTAVGGCIARHLRDVSVPAFDGDFQTIRTDLTLR